MEKYYDPLRKYILENGVYNNKYTRKSIATMKL